jgi:hypothetical protein
MDVRQRPAEPDPQDRPAATGEAALGEGAPDEPADAALNEQASQAGVERLFSPRSVAVVGASEAALGSYVSFYGRWRRAGSDLSVSPAD